jgi:hypothetical protein
MKNETMDQRVPPEGTKPFYRTIAPPLRTSLQPIMRMSRLAFRCDFFLVLVLTLMVSRPKLKLLVWRDLCAQSPVVYLSQF